MSVKMERALAAFKRMSIADRFQLMVKAGLMTEAECRKRRSIAASLPASRRPHASRGSRKLGPAMAWRNRTGGRSDSRSQHP